MRLINRRNFIYTIFSASLSTIALGHEMWASKQKCWRSFTLNLPDELLPIFKTISDNSDNIYLVGPSLLFLNDSTIPRLDFLICAKDWKQLKKQLYKQGVTPLPLLSGSTSVIEFKYRNTVCAIKNSSQLNTEIGADAYTAALLSSKAYYAHETLAYNVREKLLFDIHNVLTHRECIPIQNSDKTSILSYDTLLTGIYDASFYRLKFSKCFSDTMDEGFLSHPCNENPDYVSMLFLTTIDDILEYNSTLAFKLITSKYINTAFKEWANYPLEQITSKISGIYSQLNMPSKEPMYMLLTLSYLKKQQWRSNKNEVLFSLNTRELGYIPSSLFKITRAYELSLCLNVKELLS